MSALPRLWHTAPIVVPRWMLTLKYSLFVVLGAVAAFAGVPTLSLTTWDGYTIVWAVAGTVFAAVSAVASVRPAWEPVERWSALGLVAVLSVYAVGALILSLGDGDTARATFAIAVLITTLLPTSRAVQLLSRTGMTDA